ncbi:Anoctamin-2 [Lucilia cuprina]|nr:Anoctamin-2 [Lucilia cuprina]
MSNSVFEPDVPFWTQSSFPVLPICISIIGIFSMVVYRMAQRCSPQHLCNEDSMTTKIMFLPMTAGVIDLILISILDYIYGSLAYCRTKSEYDESLTIKNYVFQFENLLVTPQNIIYTGLRQEECNPGGCLMELCMQLCIIMVGKQAVNAIVEMLIPYLTKTFKKFGTRCGMRKKNNEEKLVSCNQWTEDYHLIPWTNHSMFLEYLEMVLQYGFITLFGLAFPLAPLLALINNIIEVRLDAIKMLKFIRRPVAERAHDIGVWFSIMTVVTKIAVASCAMIIAFSTNLIPKLVYKTATHDETLEGYLNFTLAYFNTKDFQIQPLIVGSPYTNVTSCRYTEFRNPPWDENPYKRPMIYWKILTARLAFIVVFQNIIGVLQTIIAWAIPDVSGKLLKRIKRENFLLREHIIEYEKIMAQKAAAKKLVDKAHTVASNILKGVNNTLNNSGFSDPIEEEDDEGVQLRKRNANANNNASDHVLDHDHITPV